MKWVLCLVFCLTLVILVVIKRNEEFRSRRFRTSGGKREMKKPSINTHIFVAIISFLLIIFSYKGLAFYSIIFWLFYTLIAHIFIKEGFGATSPGTMVQLSTSHVPTEEDSHYWKYVYPKQVAKEIRNMTESDLR